MGITTQKLFAWCGPAFMALAFAGLLILADCIPPPSPSDNADEIASFWREDTDLKRAGMIFYMVASALLFPWTVAVFLRMKRMEGPSAPWAYCQFAAGVGGVFLFITPVMLLQAGIYRVDTIEPEIIQLINDIAWIMFVSAASPVVIQFLALGFAILQDAAAKPVFPRWSGYLSLWIALLLAVAIVVPFFETGPLAWDGVFSYWIPIFAFGNYVLVISALMLRSLNAESRQDTAAVGERETTESAVTA